MTIPPWGGHGALYVSMIKASAYMPQAFTNRTGRETPRPVLLVFYFLKECSSLLKYINNWHFIIPL